MTIRHLQSEMNLKFIVKYQQRKQKLRPILIMNLLESPVSYSVVGVVSTESR